MAEIKFQCPGCKVTLKVSDAFAGKKIKCPKCAAIAPVPSAAAPAPAAAPPAAAAPPPPAPSPVAAPVKPAMAPAKPAAPVAPPAAHPKPAVPVAPPAAHPKPAVPMAQPVGPPPRKPTAPPPPPAPEPLDFADSGPDENGALLPDDVPDLRPEEDYEAPQPRKRAAPPAKKGRSFIPLLVSILVLAYVAGLALVYLGILMPMPEPLKAP